MTHIVGIPEKERDKHATTSKEGRRRAECPNLIQERVTSNTDAEPIQFLQLQ